MFARDDAVKCERECSSLQRVEDAARVWRFRARNPDVRASYKLPHGSVGDRVYSASASVRRSIGSVRPMKETLTRKFLATYGQRNPRYICPRRGWSPPLSFWPSHGGKLGRSNVTERKVRVYTRLPGEDVAFHARIPAPYTAARDHIHSRCHCDVREERIVGASIVSSTRGQPRIVDARSRLHLTRGVRRFRPLSTSHSIPSSENGKTAVTTRDR